MRSFFSLDVSRELAHVTGLEDKNRKAEELAIMTLLDLARPKSLTKIRALRWNMLLERQVRRDRN